VLKETSYRLTEGAAREEALRIENETLLIRLRVTNKIMSQVADCFGVYVCISVLTSVGPSLRVANKIVGQFGAILESRLVLVCMCVPVHVHA
jgi:hypothetical protein